MILQNQSKYTEELIYIENWSLTYHKISKIKHKSKWILKINKKLQLLYLYGIKSNTLMQNDKGVK